MLNEKDEKNNLIKAQTAGVEELRLKAPAYIRTHDESSTAIYAPAQP